MNVSNVKVKLNNDVMEKLNKSADRAMELTANAIVSDIVSRAVVPKDVGTLERGNDAIKSGYVEKINDMVYAIIYNTSYARRWYFNLPFTDVNGKEHKPATFQKTKNANAQDHWMEFYFDGEGKQFVIDTFMKFWREESGGIIK